MSPTAQQCRACYDAKLDERRSLNPPRRQRVQRDPPNVIWLRRAKGLSLRELAKLVDISPGYLHDIESGRRGPSTVVLNRLAEVLNCPPVALMRKDGERP
jgi:ribosome-binding protein aMBF1 (putative translation factor)